MGACLCHEKRTPLETFLQLHVNLVTTSFESEDDSTSASSSYGYDVLRQPGTSTDVQELVSFTVSSGLLCRTCLAADVCAQSYSYSGYMRGLNVAGARCAGAGCKASPHDKKASRADLGPALQSGARHFRTAHDLVLLFFSILSAIIRIYMLGCIF